MTAPRLLLLLLAAALTPAAASQPLAATRLRVNHLPAPTVDERDAPPRLSWSLQHPARAQTQTAYRVELEALAQPARGNATAATATPLQPPLLWDSGIVFAAAAQCTYAGPPLRAAIAHRWRVQWWDRNGRAAPVSAWSAAFFAAPTAPHWAASAWIAAGQARRGFTLQRAPPQATVFVAGAGFFQLWINGVHVNKADALAGAWTTWNSRVLYYTYPLPPGLLVVGANAAGITVGKGWRDMTAFPPKSHNDSACDTHEQLFRLLVVDGTGAVLLASDTSWAANPTPAIVTASVCVPGRNGGRDLFVELTTATAVRQ